MLLLNSKSPKPTLAFPREGAGESLVRAAMTFLNNVNGPRLELLRQQRHTIKALGSSQGNHNGGLSRVGNDVLPDRYPSIRSR